MERWRTLLQEAGVPIEAEVRWPGGGRSLYVRDPAGNSIELATGDVSGSENAHPDPCAGARLLRPDRGVGGAQGLAL